MSEEVDVLKGEWERERRLRMEILEIQHAEAVALHADFAARNAQAAAMREVQLRDHESAIHWREEWVAAVKEQTQALARIAAALERRAG